MRFLGLLVAAGLQAVLIAPAYACSTSVFLPQIRPGELYLLAVPRGHTIEVPYAEPPQYVGPIRSSEPQNTERPLLGWTARIEQMVGPAKDQVPSSVAEVILVPWGYGPDCRPRRWQKDQQWLEPGKRGVFSAFLRPQSQWADSRPILDVFLAWHQPYPTGEFLKHEARRANATDTTWLTVEEYWSLVETLPPAEQVRTAPERSRESLQRWAQTYPALVGRFPASMILERVYPRVK